MWDVVVSGSGPAGTVAAHLLAREGMKVLIVDRPSAPEMFTIGESLPGAAVRLMKSLGLPPPQMSGKHLRLGGNLSAWGSDELSATDFLNDPDGPGWRLDRYAFDLELRNVALASGASEHRARVRGIERERGRWRIRLDDGDDVTCGWSVDASGRAAVVARGSGARRYRDGTLVAVYGLGGGRFRLARTLVEAVPNGWWYLAGLPGGRVLAALHVRPEDAARLVAKPDEWLHALATTRHASVALSEVTFERRLRGVAAGTTGLDQVHGEGWIACGDAALAFDPISSQGIFSAIHGGMSAARATLRKFAGDNDGLAAHAAQLSRIEMIYRQRLRTTYAQERRWADEPFWAQQREQSEKSSKFWPSGELGPRSRLDSVSM